MKEYIKVTSGFLKGRKLEVVDETNKAFVAKDAEGNIATIPFDACKEIPSVMSKFYELLDILELEYVLEEWHTVVMPTDIDKTVAFIASLRALKIPYDMIDKGQLSFMEYKVSHEVLKQM